MTAYFVSCFTLFFSMPLGKAPQWDHLTEINIPTFHVALSVSVTDQVWFLLLSPLFFVSQVCVSVCSGLWLPPFLLILFFNWESPWPETVKGQQMLSPSIQPCSFQWTHSNHRATRYSGTSLFFLRWMYSMRKVKQLHNEMPNKKIWNELGSV